MLTRRRFHRYRFGAHSVLVCRELGGHLLAASVRGAFALGQAVRVLLGQEGYSMCVGSH